MMTCGKHSHSKREDLEYRKQWNQKAGPKLSRERLVPTFPCLTSGTSGWHEVSSKKMSRFTHGIASCSPPRLPGIACSLPVAFLSICSMFLASPASCSHSPTASRINLNSCLQEFQWGHTHPHFTELL